MYKVGDTVVHPMHGAGTIESIRTIEVLGKKQDYYTIRMAVGGMTTSVPVLNADKVGLREVINSAEAKKLLEAFRKIPLHDDANWNKRQRENMEKLKSGNLYQVLEVLKDLLYRDKKKGLSTNERKTLGSAKQIVLSELILSNFASQCDIESIIEDTIAELL
ncbi:MAG: CarD family transcriptional regulator [Clostridia bacterium]|nr:CarD family transcriptional regulator [Clostridia bacterium]